MKPWLLEWVKERANESGLSYIRLEVRTLRRCLSPSFPAAPMNEIWPLSFASYFLYEYVVLIFILDIV